MPRITALTRWMIQSWVPLRIERVLEVGYTTMTAGRFRGTTR